MLEQSLDDMASQREHQSHHIHQLQAACDEAKAAVEAKEQQCVSLEQQIHQRVAVETLNVHYEFEERLQQQATTIDEQHAQLEKLEARLSKVRANFHDAGVQAGDATVCSSGERDQLMRQLSDQGRHYEDLLVSERNVSERQRVHWEDLMESKLQVEREALRRTLEFERAAEAAKVEAEGRKWELMLREKDERIKALESSQSQLVRERASEHEEARKSIEALHVSRRNVEKILETTIAEYAAERLQRQADAEAAIRDEHQLYERILGEEKGQRLRIEEELGLLRADRTRLITEQRDATKDLERRLAETQVELNAQLARRHQEEDSKQAQAIKAREAASSYAELERSMLRAQEESALAFQRIEVLTRELEIANETIDRAAQDAETHGRKQWAGAMAHQREQLESLEQRHAAALAEARRETEEVVRFKLGSMEIELRDTTTRLQHYEKTVSIAFAERDAAQLALHSAQQQLIKLQTPHLTRNVLSQTEEKGFLTSTLDTHLMDNDESFRLREQLMRMNQQVWSLQSQLAHAHRDVEHYSGIVEHLQSEVASVSVVPQRDAASPLADTETQEAEALFQYFKR